jgi:hypothetical protein
MIIPPTFCRPPLAAAMARTPPSSRHLHNFVITMELIPRGPTPRMYKTCICDRLNSLKLRVSIHLNIIRTPCNQFRPIPKSCALLLHATVPQSPLVPHRRRQLSNKATAFYASSADAPLPVHMTGSDTLRHIIWRIQPSTVAGTATNPSVGLIL